jgi:hypothetical protein
VNQDPSLSFVTNIRMPLLRKWKKLIWKYPYLVTISLFDSMHGTNYSDTTTRWLSFLQENGTTDAEVSETGYLKVTYLRDDEVPGIKYVISHNLHSHHQYWIPDANGTSPSGIPVGTVGNDGWALAWLTAWTPDLDFACKGSTHAVYEKQRR